MRGQTIFFYIACLWEPDDSSPLRTLITAPFAARHQNPNSGCPLPRVLTGYPASTGLQTDLLSVLPPLLFGRLKTKTSAPRKAIGQLETVEVGWQTATR